jgi:hypothetical protein
MPAETFAPIAVSEQMWQNDRTIRILHERDVAGLLRLVQQYTGVSQGRLASALGVSQGRLNELINRKRTISALGTFERLAAGLCMPDSARMALGLAPSSSASVPIVSLPEVTGVYPSQADAATDIQVIAKKAAQIDVMAVRGLGILGLNNSLLRESASHGARLRVLLVDPDCDACARRAEEIGESAESFSAGVRLSITRLKELGNRVGQTELYLYQATPIWRIIRLDHTLFVSAFTTHYEGHTSPVHRIEPTKSGVLHAAFLRTMDEAIKTAVRVI